MLRSSDCHAQLRGLDCIYGEYLRLDSKMNCSIAVLGALVMELPFDIAKALAFAFISSTLFAPF